MGFYLYNFHCHLVPVIENSWRNYAKKEF
jgi:hypothetical protein